MVNSLPGPFSSKPYKHASHSLKLYVLLLIVALIVIATVVLILVFVRRSRSSKKRKMRVKHSSGAIPLVSKEIVEVNTLELKIDPKKKEVEMEESASVESPNIGWGRWYSLKELENATEGFAEQNVIGEGGYGIVYKGILMDGSVVAVKNLLNNKYAFFFFLCLLLLFVYL